MSMKERAPRGGRRSLKLLKDDHAVSPVIGEILMIIVVAIAAGFLTAYAYTLFHTMDTGAINILVEGAQSGSSSVTIVHMGGDTLAKAFTVNAAAPVQYLDESSFNELEVRINGAIFAGTASLNTGAIAKPDFAAGDELVLQLEQPLQADDRISIVSVPSNQVITVVV
jgi:FlaG/FlaF family flagellin (archaellin)